MMATPVHNLELNIRVARIEEAQEIYNLVKKAFADYNQTGINPVKAEKITDIYHDLYNNMVIVVEDCNQLIGSLRLVPEMESSIYLKRFCILPQYQHRGIGTMLYRQAEKIALTERVKFIYLHSSIDDERLVKFYKKLGFSCLKTDQDNGYNRGLWVKKIDGVE